jgi:hypothetical protein
LAGDEETMLRLVAGKAMEGNLACLKYCLDRLQPRRRRVRLDLPEGAEHNAAAFHAAVLRAAADGELTPEEAASFAKLAAARRPALEAHLIERRLAAADALPETLDPIADVPAAFLFPPGAEDTTESAEEDTALAARVDDPSLPPCGEGSGREGHAGSASPEEAPAPSAPTGTAPPVDAPPVDLPAVGAATDGTPDQGALTGTALPACPAHPDPSPKGGRETETPTPVKARTPPELPSGNPQAARGAEAPVNSPVVPAVSPASDVPWGVNRIYWEQDKLPKRPGAFRGFIKGSGWPD